MKYLNKNIKDLENLGKQKNTDNSLKGIKGNMGRKQIPLCKKCHFKVHSVQYNGPGIY